MAKKPSGEDFESIFGAMSELRARQDAVVSYYGELAGIGMTELELDGPRIRQKPEFAGAFYNNGEYTFADALANSVDIPKTTPDKSLKKIPALNLPLGDHYITSLKQGLGTNLPRPELRKIGSADSEIESAANARLARVSELLHRIVINKVKNPTSAQDMRFFDRLQEEAMACGSAGVRISQAEDPTTGELRLEMDFIPYEALYFSASGRWLAVRMEKYYGDGDVKKFRFVNPFTADAGPEECKAYYELYDLDAKRTYFIDAEDRTHEVKKFEQWDPAQDLPPVVVYSLGPIGADGVYACGLIERWLPIWEELVVAGSMICYYSKRTAMTKLLIGPPFSDDEDFLQELFSKNREFAALRQANNTNMVGDSVSNIQEAVMPWKPVDALGEWMNWYSTLRQMLSELQYFPDISRGIQSKSSSYMKAGTAATLDQTRARLVGEVSMVFAGFLERLYRALLDFIGAHSQIDMVSEFLKDEATLALLKRDYDVSVSVGDLTMPDEVKDAERMAAFIQAAPALQGAFQMIGMIGQSVGGQLDIVGLSSDLLDKLFGIHLKKYIRTPDMLAGAAAPPAPAGPSAQQGGMGGSMGPASDMLAMLSRIGRSDLVDEIAMLPQELQDAISAKLVQSQASAGAMRLSLSELEAAFMSGDAEGEVMLWLQR